MYSRRVTGEIAMENEAIIRSVLEENVQGSIIRIQREVDVNSVVI